VDNGDLEVAAVDAVRTLEEPLDVVSSVGKDDMGDGAIGSQGQAPRQSTITAAVILFLFPLTSRGRDGNWKYKGPW